MESLLKKQEAMGKRLVNFVTNLKKSGSAKLTPAFLTVKKDLLDSYWNTFSAGDIEIEQLATTADREGEYFTTNFFNMVEEAYTAASIFIASAKETNTTNSAQVTGVRAAHPKLPQIDIPKFAGRYNEWIPFKQLFMALIVQNVEISEVEKLYYLRGNLIGEPAKLISHLDITDSNFKTAWDILSKRYENIRLIVNSHLAQIFGISSTTPLKDIIARVPEALGALKNLGCPTESWDVILIYYISSRLDPMIRRNWEEHVLSACGPTTLPTFESFYTFLLNKFRCMEVVPNAVSNLSKETSSRQINFPVGKIITNRTRSNVLFQTSVNKLTCPNCKEAHPLGKCEQFIKWSVAQRRDFVRKRKLCYNCMKGKHTVADCRSEFHCRQCQGKHHSLLHESSSPICEPPNISTNPSTSVNSAPSSSESLPPSSLISSAAVSPSSGRTVTHCGTQVAQLQHTVLLSTALVKAYGPKGQSALCRVLLDNASERHFITAAMANQLGLRRKTHSVQINGISSLGTTSSGTVNLKIQSRISSDSYSLCAIVLPRITCELPTQSIDVSKWPKLNNVTLADPQFYKPSKIDLLIGAELFFKLLISEQMQPSPELPIYQNTKLGWILGGELSQSEGPIGHSSTYVSTTTIDDLLKKFWEVESVPEKSNPLLEEQLCDNIFIREHTRNCEGRYIVPLPLRSPPEPTNSREVALRRLLALENRLQRSPDLRNQYDKFMSEYRDQHHMERVNEPSTELYYIPHQCVEKPSSTTTKLRVVFDASCVMNNGHSLNDYQYTGPKLQQHIVSILSRFRLHTVCFTADIKAMYRQILISEPYRDFQCILWKAPNDSSPRTYRLNTVSYGLSSSPYLALRSLKQLAIDEGSCHPQAAPLLTSSVYIDDFLSGAPSIESALSLQRDLIQLLEKGGFSLRKWSSNCPELLKHLPQEHCDSASFTFEANSSIKILGIKWNPTTDKFSFQVNIPNRKSYSKRTVLSDIASIYDPCGWLAPFIISAKILMQQLWLRGIGWDDPLPSDVVQRWDAFRNDLNELSTLSIPRYVHPENVPIDSYDLHGFCDASQQAYAASVYLVTLSSGIKSSTLLASKTRVAPIKHVTIPRLELCGALLLAELLDFIKKELSLKFTRVLAWTDSTICLSWIKNYSRTLPSFVANRVSRIIEVIPPQDWKYVSSSENPADVASRGTTVFLLRHNFLWWAGPSWLSKSVTLEPTTSEPDVCTSSDQLNEGPQDPSTTEEYPMSNTTLTENELQIFASSQLSLSTQVSPSLSMFDVLLDRSSTWTKLKRILAFIFRFLQNSRHPDSKLIGPLTVKELQHAEHFWVKLVQEKHFKEEIVRLRSGQAVTSGPLRNLQPFLEDSILRVGGRLKNSTLPYDTRHPMILPVQSRLSLLICLHAHKQTLHGGTQLSIAYIRQRYWILSVRKLVKGIIFKCTDCRRHNPKPLSQEMADLPASRVTPSRPFSVCGLDYAGPVTIKTRYGRKPPLSKAYLAIFVCFSTKAVHIEVVSDLTTTACLAAIKRFVARRGLPATIWSDNSTTFTGAAMELRRTIQKLASDSEIQDYFSSNHIEWKFIPPRAPHWGGLWEAAVRSAKHHFKRVVGTAILTYEELCTLAAEIERCLNSRPLMQLHDIPETILTPGHFLVGGPLNSLPSSSVTTLPLNQRWNLVSQMYQNFWRQWSSEYLSELQRRFKWQRPVNPIQVGDIVLIREDNVKPSQWSTARVDELHHGQDGLVRVVTLRHGNRTFVRPITKLVPLVNNIEANIPNK